MANLCRKEKLAPDWHRIGMDWHGLTWIDMDWHGLARIGQDWQIDEYVSERKIGPQLAPDWHGLAWIDMDWHRLARIGTDWPGLAN